MCTLMAVGVGMSAFGTITSAYSAKRRGEEAQSVAQQNASLANQAAATAVANAAVPGLRARMRGSSVIGQQRAAYAASGAEVSTGSALDVQTDARVLTDLDESMIRYNAMQDAMGLRSKASVFHQEGEYAAQAGRDQAVSSVIGGIGKIAGMVGPQAIDSVGAKTLHQSAVDRLMSSAPDGPDVDMDEEISHNNRWRKWRRRMDVYEQDPGSSIYPGDAPRRY